MGSFSVNGVSELHSDLIKTHLFKDFYEFTPEKFNNKTNGITQRRWLLKANPRLADFITSSIGDGWVTSLNQLEKLLPFLTQKSFLEKWRDIKAQNKKNLANYVKKTMGLTVNPDSLFDVQVKRIHEYKRQLLFAFYIVGRYLWLRDNPDAAAIPRTFIFGGKAAPSYFMAKLIIKFITSIAEKINNDKSVNEKMKVVFIPNYSVSLAEKIIPAADLSEQISTAGTEASGTGNMKFMLNGALTIGTLDGANIEIYKAVGDENMFIFGLTSDEILRLKERGYDPEVYIRDDPLLGHILSLIKDNYFSPQNHGLFEPLALNLTQGKDSYFICADFKSYWQTQERVSNLYQDKKKWIEMSIINTANSGKF